MDTKEKGTKTVKDLTVKVTYRVSLGDIEIPNDVHREILLAIQNNLSEIADKHEHLYPSALEWLECNINEYDCFEWQYDIENLE